MAVHPTKEKTMTRALENNCFQQDILEARARFQRGEMGALEPMVRN
jgi:hypothetical protein